MCPAGRSAARAKVRGGQFEEFFIAQRDWRCGSPRSPDLAGAENFAGAAERGDRFSAIRNRWRCAPWFRARRGRTSPLRPLSGDVFGGRERPTVMRAGATRMQWDFWALSADASRSWWSWATEALGVLMTMTVAGDVDAT